MNEQKPEDLAAVPEAVEEHKASAQRALTPGIGTRRVPPNPDAPRLRPKTEKRIAAADEKSAQAYDELEDSREKLKALKVQMEIGAVTVLLEVGDTAVHTLKQTVNPSRPPDHGVGGDAPKQAEREPDQNPKVKP